MGSGEAHWARLSATSHPEHAFLMTTHIKRDTNTDFPVYSSKET